MSGSLALDLATQARSFVHRIDRMLLGKCVIYKESDQMIHVSEVETQNAILKCVDRDMMDELAREAMRLLVDVYYAEKGGIDNSLSGNWWGLNLLRMEIAVAFVKCGRELENMCSIDYESQRMEIISGIRLVQEWKEKYPDWKKHNSNLTHKTSPPGV